MDPLRRGDLRQVFATRARRSNTACSAALEFMHYGLWVPKFILAHRGEGAANGAVELADPLLTVDTGGSLTFDA